MPRRHKQRWFSALVARWRKWRQYLAWFRSTGTRGERVARRHLRRQHYRVLGSNLRFQFGEIDMIAETPDGRTAVIVEVKSHTNPDYPGEIHVNAAKRRKLESLGRSAIRRYRLKHPMIRFDVIGVYLPAKGKPVVRHHVSAFAP